MKLFASFTLFSMVVAKKETIIVEDDYADYPESDDFLGAKKGYEIYNPFEGMETSISSNGDMVLSDTGGRSIIHKMCGNSPIPVIVCNGCNSGFPRYTKPCNEPTDNNSDKFKCGVRCGDGYKASIKKMKCIGGRWKKLPANGKIRCLKKRKQT